jgi:hypothetical protein
MRKMAALFFFGILSAGSTLGQSSNTAAGLAGVGAGAALGQATGQGGTTPSSAGSGGGSSPIEIQIMVFKGMQEIAKNIAAVTAVHESGCQIPKSDSLKNDREQLYRDSVILDQARKILERDKKALKEDKLTPDDVEDSTQDSNKIRTDKSALKQAIANAEHDNQLLAAQIIKEENDLEIAAKRSSGDLANNLCAVLIEDPTSANQIALYQASQGYYNHLKKLDAHLWAYFSLQLPQSTVNISTTPSISVRNVGRDNRKIKGITIIFTGSGANPFVPDPSSNCLTLPNNVLIPNTSCDIRVNFPTAGTPPGTYLASLNIKSGDPDSNETDTTQTVQLSGTVAPPPPPPRTGIKSQGNSSTLGSTGAPTSGTGAPTTTGGGGAAPATPVGLTYLSDIATALGGLKSNITYSPSSFQPTTQALEVLVEAELQARGILSYTSTSALNVKEAVDALSPQFGEMLLWASEVSGWTNQCKPQTPDGTPSGKPPVNSACTVPAVVADLAIAQQLSSGYTTLLATSNDGNGNPVIVDVLRGWVLSEKMILGVPSLQVAVAAAGGSTKTNNIFGVNLFYTFAPSYNAGIIATFELRDEHNVLLESGARNVLFAYRKWKSKDFHPGELKRASTCDSFCSIENP